MSAEIKPDAVRSSLRLRLRRLQDAARLLPMSGGSTNLLHVVANSEN